VKPQSPEIGRRMTRTARRLRALAAGGGAPAGGTAVEPHAGALELLGHALVIELEHAGDAVGDGVG
jgi:hypothetical protein